ncbi:hypothetical protein KM043_008532 [Ampulex compressa]|nr:hypothetical protein KM043_008532 [Ampulex compressa]
MGLLTDPRSGTGRMIRFVLKWEKPLCHVLYFSGIIWAMLWALPAFNDSTYFSENALLPGLVTKESNLEHVSKQIHHELVHEMKRYPNVMPYAWLSAKMHQLHLDVYTHNFSLIYPFQQQKFTGQNIYGIVRAPRASSTEAIVVSVPFRPYNSIYLDTAPSVALLLAFAKFCRKQKYWAKDIIFLLTEHEQLGMQAWLDAYHGVSSGTEGILMAGDLSGRAGSIQAAINLELHAMKIGSIDVKVEGLNGQLPNLDLFNLAQNMIAKEGISQSFQRRYNVHYRDKVKNFWYSFHTLMAMIATQATGIPTGNHGLFHRFGIEAITLEGFEKVGQGSEANFYQTGRVVESIVRSLNNLLERFHQSYFFYLLASTDRYISIGLYMRPLVLMIACLFIKAFTIWQRMQTANSWNENKKDKPEEQKMEDFDIGTITSEVLWAHISGILIMFSPQGLTLIGGWLWDLRTEDSIFYGFSAITILTFLWPLCFRRPAKYGNTSLICVIASVELATTLMCIAMHNFSLALLAAVAYVPVVLMIGPKRGPSSKCRSLLYVLWAALHPLMLSMLVVLGYTCVNFPSDSFWPLLFRAYRATKQAFVFGIMDSMIYGNWLYNVTVAIMLPICLERAACTFPEGLRTLSDIVPLLRFISKRSSRNMKPLVNGDAVDAGAGKSNGVSSLVNGLGETKYSNTLIFYVNGKEVIENNVNPEWTLLWYLRNKLHLTGTKLGCAEGGCGACTIMVSRYDRTTENILHVAVNACLTPVCAMHGLSVTTVEGIGSTKTKLHPVQERIAKAHGSQCGFCTPGIVMSMYALLRSKPKPNMQDMEIAFQGNLCRCTGYRAIIEGFKTFTEEWERPRLVNGDAKAYTNGVCAMGENCCKRAFTSEPTELFNSKEFCPYDPSQEPIFPPKLQLSSELDEQYAIFKGENVTWHRPTKLSQLLELKQEHPGAKIIVGNTEVGVEVKFKHLVYPVLIQPTQIIQMREIVEGEAFKVGASVTLMEMERALVQQIKTKPESRTRIFKEVVNMLHWFAGKQIRNAAAVGGNIMTGSPISDLNPVFMAAGIKLNLCSLKNGFRSVPMDHNFFVGYRRNIVDPTEVLVSIEIPYTDENQYFIAYKQAKRRDDDIAIVNMALNLFLKPGTNVVQNANLAFGGMAPTTVLARKTCELMIGRKWDQNILNDVFDSLLTELPLADNAPGGMIKYRRSLTLSLFFKGFVHIIRQLPGHLSECKSLPKEILSASDGFHYKPPKSSQYYQVVPKNQENIDLIGRPIIHASAYKQATGEAIYCDDMPKINGELYLALVLSNRAHAKILNINATKALAQEGVVAFFSSKDIPKDRRWIGPVFHDEEVFVSEKVTSHGQVIGAIVAVDQNTAQKGARLVAVEYEDLQPVIVSIEDAIVHKSFFFDPPKRIRKGDPEKAFAEAEHILEGEVRMGGQEHFYLETHASFVVPKEEDELEVFCSTQHPTEVQHLISHVLGIQMNRVNLRVKRLGGGFGGKESRPSLLAIPAALAAHRLRKPVRCMLDRDEDMMISGTRHPFYYRYKVGFNGDGRIKVVEIHIYNNGGYSYDLSTSVLERAMFHFENSYKIPVADVYGYVCKTNLPSNTAFRGFGGPQGMFAGETIMRHVAEYLRLDIVQLSESNLYKEGEDTHYNQKLIGCTLRNCWKECVASSNYHERCAEIERYNRENRYKKKGIAIVPTKFGIAFTALFLNQAGALVHVYMDGSVLISHGGVEMGQGLHTKMIQVASRILKADPNKIHIVETSTDKVPNTSATAASAGSDLNGMAVMYACQKIMGNLKPVIESKPDGTWEEWIKSAYFQRIGLSATGFYQTPDIGYSFDTNSGMAFNYFTYGAACTEVEIDCLTGDHQVLRTDIVMDLGESLNPAIDIGQVEGGFVQGYGLFTLEEMVYSPTGMVFSRGPGVYKLPGFADIPQEFNVSLLKGSSNPRAVYSSKAVGEPPLFLASSAFFAIREAVKAARKDMNMEGYFRLDAPATAARIRTACLDNLLMKIKDPDLKKQWNTVP